MDPVRSRRLALSGELLRDPSASGGDCLRKEVALSTTDSDRDGSLLLFTEKNVEDGRDPGC